MSKYRIVESVGASRQQVHSFEDLEIHHPSKHGHEAGRHYQMVDGHNEEVLSSRGTVTRSKEGHVFVSKDMIFLNDATGSKDGVRLPAPAEGYIKIEPNSGLVKIYDKLPDGEMIAQVRHMDMRGSPLKDGDHIAYGQPMGIQAGMGHGKLHEYPTHTHIDFNANHLDKFRQYIKDVDSGAITTDRYPRAGEVTAPANSPAKSADGLLREDSKGADVRHLQELLKQHGAQDAQGRDIQVDGDFGKRTREAVEAYQKANKLEVDGVAGPETMRSLGESRQRTDAAPTMRDAGGVGHEMYTQAYDKLKEMGPEKGGYRNEQELQRVAGSVAADASMTGLKRIDEIKRSTIGDGYFAVEGTAADPAHHRAYVDGAQARTQTLEQSSQTLQQETQRQPQQPQQPQDVVRETPARTMLA